jgi:hypothetical protein
MSNKLIPNLSVTDGFDFVKKIWGSLPIPNVINPTTDLEELDKRIADLKAVEQWLNVNLSMLRATIQGLEVQRGTIATIKSFGSSFVAGGSSGDKSSGALDEQAIRRMMAQMVEQAPPATEPPEVPSSKAVESKVPEALTEGISNLASEAQEQSKAIISNASVWWGLLQDQLNKVATAAMSGAGLGSSDEDSSAKKTGSKITTKTSKSKVTGDEAKPSRSSKSSTRSSSTRSSRSKS